MYFLLLVLLLLWKIVKYIQYHFFTFKHENDRFASWVSGLWLQKGLDEQSNNFDFQKSCNFKFY